MRCDAILDIDRVEGQVPKQTLHIQAVLAKCGAAQNPNSNPNIHSRRLFGNAGKRQWRLLLWSFGPQLLSDADLTCLGAELLGHL